VDYAQGDSEYRAAVSMMREGGDRIVYSSPWAALSLARQVKGIINSTPVAAAKKATGSPAAFAT
jgi:hypothetical protein